MKKEDLKVGYVVVTKNNESFIVMNVKDMYWLCLVNDSYWISLGDYDEELNYCSNPKNSIQQVYGLSRTVTDSIKASIEHRDLLWERPVTYKSKFLEAFPNVKLTENGELDIYCGKELCCGKIFGEPCKPSGYSCSGCWNREYKE